ncbi:hypothetical protein [Methanogenium cariaci]|uniref:hypothetical protein n=1 Tax=Methanogenium cariaci TaxID=2197 RepID=UPI0007861F8B|nr:hypothetical protein [Methanogenium cariaci]
MKTPKIYPHALFVLFLLGMVAAGPVSATDTGALPLDTNGGDALISTDELAASVLTYMERTYAAALMQISTRTFAMVPMSIPTGIRPQRRFRTPPGR